MVRCQNFNTRAVHQFYFGRYEKIGGSELKQVVQGSGVAVTSHEIFALLARFDSNFDSYLSFSDVGDMFTPSSAPLQTELMRRTFAG